MVLAENLIENFWKKALVIKNAFSPDKKWKAKIFVKKEGLEILFQEKGSSPYGSFYNELLWKKKDLEILLYKKRPEKAGWVHMATFHPTEKGFEAKSPYICSQDVYFPILEIDAKGFSLRWKVKGPKKHAQYVFIYR